jgi:hypothetical protein
LRQAENDAEADHRHGQRKVDEVLALEYNGRALEQAELVFAGELAEGNHRPGKGNGADNGTDE